MILVEPVFDFILSNPDAFASGKEAIELLFTDKFLETMLKEASQDATLASSSAGAKAIGRKVTAHPSQSSRVLRPRKENPAHFSVKETQNHGGGRGRPSDARSWIRGCERYVSVPPFIDNKGLVFKAARINVRRSSFASSKTGPRDVSIERNTPAIGIRRTTPSRMETVRRQFRVSGFSAEMVDLLVAGNRTGTIANYDSA